MSKFKGPHNQWNPLLFLIDPSTSVGMTGLQYDIRNTR